VKTRVELDLTSRDIEQLRELMDNLPLNPYGPLVVTVLKALPLDSRGSLPTSYCDTPPTVNISALTDKGKAAMPALIKLLGPHL